MSESERSEAPMFGNTACTESLKRSVIILLHRPLTRVTWLLDPASTCAFLCAHESSQRAQHGMSLFLIPNHAMKTFWS